ncbi:hypothetical protein TNCV_2174631 [Trichonephila clavipes]|nr:hypothetical protein TNCV_2174631 [Trichonephila clavipes]
MSSGLSLPQFNLGVQRDSHRCNNFILKVLIQTISNVFWRNLSLHFNPEVFGGRVFTRQYELPRREHRSDQQNEMTAPKMVKKEYKIVLEDQRLNLCELTDRVSISQTIGDGILTKNMHQLKAVFKMGVFVPL